jgi:hypothetical protein
MLQKADTLVKNKLTAILTSPEDEMKEGLDYQKTTRLDHPGDWVLKDRVLPDIFGYFMVR